MSKTIRERAEASTLDFDCPQPFNVALGPEGEPIEGEVASVAPYPPPPPADPIGAEIDYPQTHGVLS